MLQWNYIQGHQLKIASYNLVRLPLPICFSNPHAAYLTFFTRKHKQRSFTHNLINVGQTIALTKTLKKRMRLLNNPQRNHYSVSVRSHLKPRIKQHQTSTQKIKLPIPKAKLQPQQHFSPNMLNVNPRNPKPACNTQRSPRDPRGPQGNPKSTPDAPRPLLRWPANPFQMAIVV